MKRALPFLLLGVAGLLLCIGIGALALNFVSGRQPSTDLSRWKAPQEQVLVNRINPAVALAVLAMTTDAGTADDSLAAGDWEGAFAEIAYGTEFSDASRVGTLLLLGDRYSALKQFDKAAWAFQYAVFLATVSPLPSDLTRIQTLLEASQGLRPINAPAARAALDQAYLIAQYSFSLPRDTRAALLEQIAQGYALFGANRLAEEARTKSAEVALLAAEESEVTTRRPFRLRPTNPPENPELTAKIETRVRAARELLDALALNRPQSESELPVELISALGDELYEEDGLRMAHYDAQYDAAVDASAQLGVLRDKIRWLVLKYRVARLGFGLSILPEWEGEVDKIAQELSDTYAEYFLIVEEQAGRLEKQDESLKSVEDVLRSSIVAGRWGFYPQYDEAEIATRLDIASQALRDAQVNSLRLDSFMRGDQRVYLLVPDELYGQGERALPR